MLMSAQKEQFNAPRTRDVSTHMETTCASVKRDLSSDTSMESLDVQVM